MSVVAEVETVRAGHIAGDVLLAVGGAGPIFVDGMLLAGSLTVTLGRTTDWHVGLVGFILRRTKKASPDRLLLFVVDGQTMLRRR